MHGDERNRDGVPGDEPLVPAVGDRRMGFGEILRRAAAPHALEILAPHPKDRWHGRDPGDQLRPELAGAAVLVDGELFEVMEHREPEQEGERHSYLLSPWDPRHPIRGTPTEYSLESVRAGVQDRIRRRHNETLRARMDWLGVFVALLPRSEQERLHREHGFNAVFWTRWSGLVLTLAALSAAIYVARFFREPWFPFVIIALVYFLLEQSFRRAKAVGGEPCGSVLGVAWMFVVRKRQPERPDR